MITHRIEKAIYCPNIYSKSFQISSPLLSGISTLEAAAATLTGKANKKERAAKGKEVAELKAEQCHGCLESTLTVIV